MANTPATITPHNYSADTNFVDTLNTNLQNLKNKDVANYTELNSRIDNLSFTGSEHDALVTAALVDAEGEDFGPEGNATYLNGRLNKWEQKIIQLKRKVGFDFLISGHRGFAAYAPENTIAALAYCYNIKADAVEIDIYTTSDGEFILMHDPTVDRTTDGTGNISDLTLNQIKELDAGSWKHIDYAGEKVPTLQEALTYAKGKFKLLYMDLKNISDYTLLYNIVKDADMLNYASFHSVHTNNGLSTIRNLDKYALISLWTTGSDYGLTFEKAKELQAFEINIDWAWLRDNLTKIDEIHAENMRVSVWNADTVENAKTAIKAGVNGLNMYNPSLGVKL